MKKFGLIGFPLSHSFSKEFFNTKFKNEGLDDYQYENFPIESIQELPQLIKDNPDLVGLNVTIPYKEKVIPFLDHISVTSREIGAVNTIQILHKRKGLVLEGYNTDEYGFRNALDEELREDDKKALILGTGGAAKAVEFALRKKEIDFQYVSRSEGEDRITYEQLTPEVIQAHSLIINTTPIGMYPSTGEAPDIPYDALTPDHYLFDLVYNPEKTKFLEKGEKKGARVKNGKQMLEVQAVRSWKIWTEPRKSSRLAQAPA